MQLKYGIPGAQRGVGLIEVLIAVLVLSFGMLGLVGLQTWSLRNNQSALERGMATVQTHSIVEAMRSDRAGALSNSYNIALTDDPPTATGSFRDVAIAQWRAALIEGLNSTAKGSITCTSGECAIVVQWDDSRGQGGATTYQIRTEVEL